LYFLSHTLIKGFLYINVSIYLDVGKDNEKINWKFFFRILLVLIIINIIFVFILSLFANELTVIKFIPTEKDSYGVRGIFTTFLFELGLSFVLFLAYIITPPIFSFYLKVYTKYIPFYMGWIKFWNSVFGEKATTDIEKNPKFFIKRVVLVVMLVMFIIIIPGNIISILGESQITTILTLLLLLILGVMSVFLLKIFYERL